MCTSRPPISDPMQREIRRRCGFGCVMCGKPLYEYHHMKDWSMTHEHVADDITLLCSDHHTEATRNLVTKETVDKANQRPHNLKNGASNPYKLHFQSNNGTIIVGNSTFTTNLVSDHAFSAILVDMISLIGFRLENGFLLIELTLLDEHNIPVLTIRDNELVYKTDIWDVQFEQNNLIVRREHKDIILDIVFSVPNKIIIRRGELHANGVRIDISRDTFMIQSCAQFNNCHITSPHAGIVIGQHPPNLVAAFVLDPINRSGYDNNKTQ